MDYFDFKELDNAWKELGLVMENKKMTIGQVLGGESYLGQKGISETGSTFQIHALMSELYRKTAEVKVGKIIVKWGLPTLKGVLADYHIVIDLI